MEKQNDYFLNLLNNPTFNADDFNQVGLSVDNTSIQDKNTYLNSNYIRELDVFKTNGIFDESKLNNFYDYAKAGFQDLAKIKEIDDLGRTWKAYRNDISMPEYLRDNSPQFKIQKVANPLRQQEGFVNFGLRENPTQSIREIAQSQQVWDPETNSWKEAPNDTPFDNFLNPKILATYDEDGTHEDPITGETVQHKKGDRKINPITGTYYYENLGNRSIYGKEVLSAFDTLTTDGSTWNKLDFLDSDDIEKSFGGSLMRAAAQIVPAFIPGVDVWYIGARVGLGLAQILPAVGKTFESLSGIETENSLFNKLEAWDKSLSFSQSDYTTGSQTDDGKILQDSHLWSWETGLKLIADVFTQLAEQRWMFEKSTSLFSGLNKEVIYNKEAQKKWIEDYIEKNLKSENMDDILKGISKGVDPRTTQATIQSVNWSKAQKVLESQLKGAQELGSKLSMAYMTGITTASSFGEAKEQGASDLEAALFTLGYTFGEWKLLNSDLGKWILLELKSEERHIKNVINKAMPGIKEATNNAETKTELGKAKWYQKLFELGKNAYHNNLGQGIASETIGSTVSNMASEALEETSEELLLDFSKVIFNAGTSLFGSDTKFNDAFENVFDRYALSFLGGAVGGGIAGTLPSYRAARADRNITQEAATKEIVDLIQQGKEKEIFNTVDKMTFGSRYLDEQGNQVDDYTKSQDYMIKQNFKRLVTNIKDILDVNGANLDKDSLLKELGPKDIRYGMLATLASQKSNAVSWYLNRYNELSSKLVTKSLALKNMQEIRTDEEQRKENSDVEKSKESVLKEEIKTIKEELDKFKDGTMSDEFILDALFEMTSKISGFYVPNIEDYIKKETGKKLEDLNQSEQKEWLQRFNDSRPIRRDLMRIARQIHIQNMEWLAKALTEYNEEYFQNKEQAINNLEKILQIYQDSVVRDQETTVPRVEQYLALRNDRINPLLYNLQQGILASLEENQAKSWLEKIEQIQGTNLDLAKQIGINAIPQTLEQLKSLDEDSKKKLFTALGKNISDVESLINDTYTKTNPETNEQTLGEQFQNDVRTWERNVREEQTLEFNSQLIAFLSDENVKKEIIKRLSSAKYINPSVKQALKDFFTTTIQGNIYDKNGELIYDEESGDPEVVSLKQSLVKEYLESFENKPSSPVDVYLNNVVLTLKSKGIEISPLVANMEELVSKLAKVRNLESFAYTDEMAKTIDQALQVIELAKIGLDSAATSINGDLSDAYGFNVSVNEIRAKRKKSGENKQNYEELATIPSDIAEGIKLDIENYERALRTFKSIQAYNSNQALKEHDKAFSAQNLNIYTKIKDFVGHLEAGDWKELDKLKQFIESSKFKDLKEQGELSVSDYKEQLTEARLNLDKAIHTFFQANLDKISDFKSDEDRQKGIEQISKLLKALNFSFDYTKDPNTTITSEEKSLPDKDLLWYLASMAAVDPTAIMYKYSKVISSEYAPVIGQEEAIRTASSFLVNPKVFELFTEAYNKNILESNISNKGYLLVNAFRSIFIEGLPGAGKSTAVLKTITDIVHEVNPNILKKVVVVSNSKENSKRLADGLKFAETSEVQTYGIEEFKSKVMNGYKTFDSNSDGTLKIERKDVKYNQDKKAWEYADFSLNSDAFDGTFLIIDEATSLSQMDALMIDKLQESKGIYGLYAGDFDQIGLEGKIEIEKDKHALISQDGTNYISSHKLGQVIRGNNTYKSDDIIKFRLNKQAFADSLRQNGKPSITTFSYYLDNSGVYGDVVAKFDEKVTSSGKIKMLDQGTKDIIDIMISSLKENEKINYIYDDQESEMYKYLTSKYPDQINLVSTKAAQSQEGQYYIVDINIKDNLPQNESGFIESLHHFKNLYTAMSRAKQATLIYDRSGDEVISKRLNSIRQTNLVHSNIGKEARVKYAKERKEAINKALNGIPENPLKFNWDEMKLKKEPPIEKKPEDDEDVAEEESEDKRTDIRNNPKEVDIKNDSEDSLNMMIHSFNTHEAGGIINSNGELELSDRHNERVDNAHGIVKALGLQVVNGKLSKEDTDKVSQILHDSRRAGLYETTPNKVVSKIREAFGLSAKDSIEVNFIYKNSQENNTLTTRGTLSKFFKGIKDKLMYLFNPNPNEKIETPSNRTIGLEIFINGNQVDIPIGTFTSPITLMETKGFEKLKEIYINSGEDLRFFERELKRIKEESIRTGVNPNIPHLNSMLKLLEVYQWNYNHNTGWQNFVVRFNKNFVLNTGKITGVQTPPIERGQDYKDKDYWYVGERLPLESYRKLMPNRKISNIYENLGEDIKDSEGNVVLEHGLPFILVSDYYNSGLNDQSLYEQYIKQIKNGEPPLITRVYVYLPTESIDYFLYNQQEALRQNEEKSAKDVDNSIGNKLTSYRLLSFMLQNDSNFKKAFEDYINNSKGTQAFNDEQKELSLKRFEKLQEIIKYISNYENSLTGSYAEGSKSKQILNFLNQTPENIKSNHPELYKLFWGKVNIGNTNWSMRTILQYEFRKLLFSGLYYEDSNSSPSLSGQDFYITKDGDNNFTYKDYQIDRINALKEDAKKNNWNGVMFHSSLEKESEIVTSYGPESYKIARINAEGASFISSKAIDLNGKLDSTAVIRDVEPMLDEILQGLVISNKNGIVTSSVNETLSDNAKQQKYDENTGAYLNAKPRNTTPNPKEELLNKVLNILHPSDNSKPEVIKTIKEFIEREGTDFIPRNLLNLAFPVRENKVILEKDGKYKITTLPKDSELLIQDDDEAYYSENGKIYKGSDRTSIEDVNTLQSLLQQRTDGKTRRILRGAKEIINNKIQELLNPKTEEELFDIENYFGISLEEFQNYVNNNPATFEKENNTNKGKTFDAITTDSEGKTSVTSPLNALLGYLAKVKFDRNGFKQFRSNFKEGDVIEKFKELGYDLDEETLNTINKNLNEIFC